MMLAYRLVRLIETHSERLATGLLEKLRHCDKCRAFSKVPAEEFRQRVYEIYDHLGEWLLGKSEADVERRYVEIGARRYAQGVPLSQLIEAIVLTREHLWDYLRTDANIEHPVEVFGEIELLQMLEQFFDKAMYYAAVGYEAACRSAQHQHEAREAHVLGR